MEKKCVIRITVSQPWIGYICVSYFHLRSLSSHIWLRKYTPKRQSLNVNIERCRILTCNISVSGTVTNFGFELNEYF